MNTCANYNDTTLSASNLNSSSGFTLKKKFQNNGFKFFDSGFGNCKQEISKTRKSTTIEKIRKLKHLIFQVLSDNL